MMTESDRRSFLLGAPMAMLALDSLSQTALGQAPSQQPVSQDVVDYWVRHMGVPPSALPGGEEAAERASRGAGAPGLAREPFFFHVDPKEGLVPAEDVEPTKLMPQGDYKVDLQLARLRLNSPDQAVFGKYSSGGLYIDLQQSQLNTEASSATASSFFSALTPVLEKAAQSLEKKPKGSGKSSGTSSGKSSGGASGSPAAPPGGSSAPAGSVQLSQTQNPSIALPGGIGHAAFSCFAKDPKKSAFGQMVAAFLSSSNNPLATFFPVLSIPILAVSSLPPVRTMVANLQAHGENAWILQSGQLNLAATGEGASTLKPSVRILAGDYIAVPKSQVSAMKGKLSDWVLMDGFLVPKNTDRLSVYDVAPTVFPEITYLSLTAAVSKTKIAGCSASGGTGGAKEK